MFLLHLLDGFPTSTGIRLGLQSSLFGFIGSIRFGLGLLLHLLYLGPSLGVPSLQLKVEVVLPPPLLLLELLNTLIVVLVPLSSLV